MCAGGVSLFDVRLRHTRHRTLPRRPPSVDSGLFGAFMWSWVDDHVELGLYLLATSGLLTSAMAAATALTEILILHVLRNQRADGIRLSALTFSLDQN